MWEEAIDVFKSLNQLDDNNVASHYALSLSYLKLDKKEEANKELLKVLELDPKHTVCMFNLAQLYLKEKKCDDAIFWYKKLLATDAKFVSAYFGIACAYQLKGDMQNAIKYWERAYEYDNKNIGALLNLANAYLSQNDLQMALRKARSAYLVDKKNPDVVMTYAIILLRGDNIYDAMEKFTEVLELKPDFIPARFALIECKIKTNKPKEAMAELEKYRDEYGQKREFVMLNLLAYLKIDEMEQNNYLSGQILDICDRILSTYGEDSWVQSVKEEFEKKQNNAECEG